MIGDSMFLAASALGATYLVYIQRAGSIRCWPLRWCASRRRWSSCPGITSSRPARSRARRLGSWRGKLVFQGIVFGAASFSR